MDIKKYTRPSLIELDSYSKNVINCIDDSIITNLANDIETSVLNNEYYKVAVSSACTKYAKKLLDKPSKEFIDNLHKYMVDYNFNTSEGAIISCLRSLFQYTELYYTFKNNIIIKAYNKGMFSVPLVNAMALFEYSFCDYTLEEQIINFNKKQEKTIHGITVNCSDSDFNDIVAFVKSKGIELYM